MNLLRKRNSFNSFVLFLTFIYTLVLFAVPALQAEAADSNPNLDIVGTGLVNDVEISGEGWNNYSQEERIYSARNKGGYYVIWKVRGYDLFDLIGKENLRAGAGCSVAFKASDGFTKTFAIDELISRYSYPYFSLESGVAVNPMLGFYRAELFNADKLESVAWEDRELTEDDADAGRPRLYMGQEDGNIDDINQSSFLKNVERIVVGYERPDVFVTGTGLKEDVLFNKSDDKEMTESYFSSNNNYDFHKIWKVKGYELLDFIGGRENLITDDLDPPIFIEAEDGYTVNFRLNDLYNLYYHPDFTADSAAQVDPMIGFYRKELFDVQKEELNPPVVWEDQDLTEEDYDKDSPRLYIGQKRGDVHEINQSKFIKKVARIVVGGDEKPVGFKYGDVNKDGKEDVSDAIVILRYIVGLQKRINPDQFTLADVDGDFKINVTDAILVLKKTVQLIEDFPVEQ